MQVANVSKPFLRKHFGGLLGPAELGFEKFCIEMTSIYARLPFLSARRSGVSAVRIVQKTRNPRESVASKLAKLASVRVEIALTIRKEAGRWQNLNASKVLIS